MIVNVQAEESVIGSVLINPTLINTLQENLPPEAFTEYRQKIWSAMIELGMEADLVTVAEKCGDNSLAYLAHIGDKTPSSANAKAYAAVVRDKYQLRMAIESHQTALELLSAESGESTPEKINRAQSAVLGLSDDTEKNGPISIHDALKVQVAEWNRRSQLGGKLDGLATGLTALDNRLMGLRPGALCVLAGRPGMGKTSVALKFAENVAFHEQKKTMFFSLEMPTGELVDRITSSVANIPLKVLKKCDPQEFGHHAQQINNAATRIKALNDTIVVDDTPSLNINQIAARARIQHVKSPLGLIIIDHIGIMGASSKENRERQVALITAGLKRMAKEFGCPVIALSQLSRKVEERPSKRPQLSDLRESGAIEQDADQVIFAYREGYYFDDSPNQGILELITAKLRDGETGSDFFSCNLANMQIGNLMDGQSPVEYAPQKAAPRGFG